MPRPRAFKCVLSVSYAICGNALSLLLSQLSPHSPRPIVPLTSVLSNHLCLSRIAPIELDPREPHLPWVWVCGPTPSSWLYPTALSNSRCVSRFNFSALLLTFHYHGSPRFHHHASGRSKEISQHKSKSATTQNLTQPPLLTDPVALHAPIVQINIRTRDNRAHSKGNYPSIMQVLTIALTVSLAAGRGAQ